MKLTRYENIPGAGKAQTCGAKLKQALEWLGSLVLSFVSSIRRKFSHNPGCQLTPFQPSHLSNKQSIQPKQETTKHHNGDMR